MSLKIIKAGVLDTIQDLGRYGYQHLGINPNGAMDRFSAQLANSLLGKDLDAPVIEMHFPAAGILFQKEAIICLTGAHFTPVINGKEIALNQPIAVGKNTLLECKHIQFGTCCYVAVLNRLAIDKWLDSYSTNIKAKAGGWQGRALQKDDILPYQNEINLSAILGTESFVTLHWKAVCERGTKDNIIQFIKGPEWHWLNNEAQEDFLNTAFIISHQADRMGYPLNGKILATKNQQQLVSSAVNFGTVQLLPSGQLIVLMADHQTTGGYPRVAHIITAHLSLLAQKRPNDMIQFSLTTLQEAEQQLLQQQKYLQQLQTASKFNMEKRLHVTL